jgi:hypothetical protein
VARPLAIAMLALVFVAPFVYDPLAKSIKNPKACNVWFRIWPAQQKIVRAVKEGTAPDAALVALAGSRSS